MQLYKEKKDIQKQIEDKPDEEFSEALKEYAQIEPELQEWVDQETEREKKMYTKMRDEFFEHDFIKDKGYDRETLTAVFDEIISNDLTNEGEAAKFYQQMWEKMTAKVN